MTLSCWDYSGKRCHLVFGASAYPDAIIGQLISHIEKRHRRSISVETIRAKVPEVDYMLAKKETERIEAAKLKR